MSSALTIEHSNRGHAKYGMSSMYRWLRCPTAIRYAQYVKPRPSSPAAIRGTLLHEWQNYWMLKEVLGFRSRLMPPVQEITEEERDAVRMILAYVRDIMERHPDIQVLTEQYAPFPQEVVPQEDCGGTVDIILYSQALGQAWVLDSKFGRVYVNEIHNAQGLGYAVSGLWKVPVHTVTVIIAQPFSPGPDGKLIREWTIGSDYLLEFQTEVEAALRRSEHPSAQPMAGSWCTYCAAELVCHANRARLEADTGRNFAHVVPLDGGLVPDPEPIMREMPDDQIARLLQIDKAMRHYLDAARREATLRARQGRRIPGHKLVEAQAKSTWKIDKTKQQEVRSLAFKLTRIVAEAVFENPMQEFEAEQAGYFDELLEKFIVITTPNLGDTEETIRAEIRKMLEDRQVWDEKTQSFVEMPEKQKNEIVAHAARQMRALTEKKLTGEPVLVPLDSPREDWNPARKMFAHVKRLE